MDANEQNEPIMAGSGDASNEDKLSGLIEQVEQDHGHEGAAAMADNLRDRMDETATAPEESGDSEN